MLHTVAARDSRMRAQRMQKLKQKLDDALRPCEGTLFGLSHMPVASTKRVCVKPPERTPSGSLLSNLQASAKRGSEQRAADNADKRSAPLVESPAGARMRLHRHLGSMPTANAEGGSTDARGDDGPRDPPAGCGITHLRDAASLFFFGRRRAHLACAATHTERKARRSVRARGARSRFGARGSSWTPRCVCARPRPRTRTHVHMLVHVRVRVRGVNLKTERVARTCYDRVAVL